MRANPKSLCRKWGEISDAMSDEEHAELDAKARNASQLAWLSNNDPAFAKWQAKIRDSALPIWAWNNTKPFSIFKS
jgi:hypothetical protein